MAGPGFLNLFLRDGWYLDATRRMLAEGGDHGRRVLPVDRRLKIDVELRERQTRLVRCTSATRATRRWATRSAGCSPSPGTT